MIQLEATPKTSPTQPPKAMVMTTNATIMPTVVRKTPGSVLSRSARMIRSDMVSLVVWTSVCEVVYHENLARPVGYAHSGRTVMRIEEILVVPGRVLPQVHQAHRTAMGPGGDDVLAVPPVDERGVVDHHVTRGQPLRPRLGLLVEGRVRGERTLAVGRAVRVDLRDNPLAEPAGDVLVGHPRGSDRRP